MKVVLDTNVFVSGVFFGGTPGRVLEAWRDGTTEGSARGGRTPGGRRCAPDAGKMPAFPGQIVLPRQPLAWFSICTQGLTKLSFRQAEQA